jgi:hypothetical protein
VFQTEEERLPRHQRPEFGLRRRPPEVDFVNLDERICCSKVIEPSLVGVCDDGRPLRSSHSSESGASREWSAALAAAPNARWVNRLLGLITTNADVRGIECGESEGQMLTRIQIWLLTHVHRAIYVGSRGHLAGGTMVGLQIVMLTTTGRKSGRMRTIPLNALADGDR